MYLFKKFKCLIIAIILITITPNLTTSSFKTLNKNDMVEKIIKINNKEIAFNIDKYMNILPIEVIERLYKKNIKIKVVEDINQSGNYGKIASKYSHKNKTIIIEKRYLNKDVLYHEIGHAYSYNKIPIIKISDKKSFKKLYVEESEVLFPKEEVIKYENFEVKNEYIKSSFEEYYAQCFSMYFTKTLNKNTKTYIYFDKYFKS